MSTALYNTVTYLILVSIALLGALHGRKAFLWVTRRHFLSCSLIQTHEFMTA